MMCSVLVDIQDGMCEELLDVRLPIEKVTAPQPLGRYYRLVKARHEQNAAFMEEQGVGFP